MRTVKEGDEVTARALASRKWTVKDQAPVSWSPLHRGCKCLICDKVFPGRRMPGDRSGYPVRNRARGAAIKHLNEAHPETCP